MACNDNKAASAEKNSGAASFKSSNILFAK